jgi:hypothetical protein
MAGKFIVLSMTASLLFLSGCSKNRGWLSRNDYSEMQDPFMEPGSKVANTSDETSKAAGRASLDDEDSTLAEGRARVPGLPSDAMAGPKPIRQASSASSQLSKDGRRIAAATYPEDDPGRMAEDAGNSGPRTSEVKSYSGPALSDFLQQKTAAAREPARHVATETDQLPTRTVSAATSGGRESLNPAATRAAVQPLSEEAENFSDFLSQNSTGRSNTVNERIVETQEDSAEMGNFASWAEQQKSNWSKSGNNANSAVTAAPALANEKSGRIFDQARQAGQEMANAGLGVPDFDAAGSEVAEPLIKKPRPDLGLPALSKAKPPAANGFTVDENPFAESPKSSQTKVPVFDETPSPKSAATSSTVRSSSTSKSLDDGFRIDTGWKPVQLTRP